MLPQWKNWFSKTKNKEKMDTDKLISLKENFTGQRFQWVKTDQTALLGKVVKCRDVEPLSNGRFLIVFDDGSKIDSSKLNSNLMMLHGDDKPLSREEAMAINGPIRSPEVKRTPPVAPPVNGPANPTNPMQPIQTAPVQNQQPAAPKPNMFAMFNSEESQISINLTVKLPDRKLLKMMYNGAENKDKFLSELAEYLHGMINKQVVQDSMKSILAPVVPAKKEAKPTVNLTEVNESR
jgi:hypothetical protein